MRLEILVNHVLYAASVVLSPPVMSLLPLYFGLFEQFVKVEGNTTRE